MRIYRTRRRIGIGCLPRLRLFGRKEAATVYYLLTISIYYAMVAFSVKQTPHEIFVLHLGLFNNRFVRVFYRFSSPAEACFDRRYPP